MRKKKKMENGSEEDTHNPSQFNPIQTNTTQNNSIETIQYQEERASSACMLQYARSELASFR